MMRKAWLFLFLLALPHSTVAEDSTDTSNFINLSFPRGISIAAPRHWYFLDENLRVNLRAFAEATMKISGLEYPQGVETTLVAANGYTTGKFPTAVMRLTIVTGETLSQQQVQSFTENDLLQLGRETKKALEIMFASAENPQEIEWITTKLDHHRGLTVLVHEYYRQPRGREKVLVQMSILFLGDKEVKLTLSRVVTERIWIPVLKYIRSSWRVDG